MVEKEVLALLRILDICYTTLVSRAITVFTRYSTLAWLLQSSGLNGRLGRWAALLSNWTLEIRRSEKGEDEILGMLAASITPREEVDEVLIAIAPRKQPRQTISMPPPTVEVGENLLVASFDGSARVKKKGGAYSAIVWKLLEWTIVAAASEFAKDLTVNEAEYRGLLLSFDLLAYTPSCSCSIAADIAHLLAYTTITGDRSGSKCFRIGVAAILAFNRVNAIVAFSQRFLPTGS